MLDRALAAANALFISLESRGHQVMLAPFDQRLGALRSMSEAAADGNDTAMAAADPIARQSSMWALSPSA